MGRAAAASARCTGGPWYAVPGPCVAQHSPFSSLLWKIPADSLRFLLRKFCSNDTREDEQHHKQCLAPGRKALRETGVAQPTPAQLG